MLYGLCMDKYIPCIWEKKVIHREINSRYAIRMILKGLLSSKESKHSDFIVIKLQKYTKKSLFWPCWPLNESHPLWSGFFRLTLVSLHKYLQNVSTSKLKWWKGLSHYYPSVTGNLSNELSHLSLSVSICLFLSALLSAVPTLDTIWITSHRCSLSFVRTTVIRHLAWVYTSGEGWLSFSQECGWCASERPTGTLLYLFWTLLNLTK